MGQRKLRRHTGRNLLVGGIIVFCLLISVYVSIPDYPRGAYPWEIMLWGERSQWWSEITWILLFGVFSVSLTYIIHWQRLLPPNPRVEAPQRLCRLIWGVSSVCLIWNFSAIHFAWRGWYSTLILDSGGYLHGVFYLVVVLLGVLLFEELLAFVSRIVPRLSANMVQ